MDVYYRKFELIDDAVVYEILKKSLGDIKKLGNHFKKFCIAANRQNSKQT